MQQSVKSTDEELLEEEVVPLAEPDFVEATPEEYEAKAAAEPAAELPALAPATLHPAAAVGEVPFPLAEPGDYYIGLWSGIPNYGCPYCGYASLDGPGAVELHILAKIDAAGDSRHQKALEIEGGSA